VTDTGDTEVVLDAKGLRALAHPVRVQLVGLLRLYGPSTATRLAERLGLASGATSYHLRQLAAAGFVEEDTERGNARDRWWRAVHATTRLDDMSLAEREPEAMLAYVRSIVGVHTLRTQLAVNAFPTLPPAWREAFDMSDWNLRLTPDEARRLNDELCSVIARYRTEAGEGAAGEAPTDAERVLLIMHLLPDLDETS
jgi:DNA-binding transcriptional ArsR family regulator